VAIATVYGRYHYLVDAVAGLIVSILAAALVLTFVGRHRRY
jgi:membrane-associated phospholipid phosphatase